MKPGSKDIQLKILITGDELIELQRHTYQMAEAFGLDRRIENYQGKRPIGFYSWDFDCLLAVIECALEDKKEYPDKDKNSDPLMALSRRQLEFDLQKALESLPTKQRSVFQLKVFQEMRISEIAETMGLAEGTVKTHLFRATRVIQKRLRRWVDN